MSIALQLIHNITLCRDHEQEIKQSFLPDISSIVSLLQYYRSRQNHESKVLYNTEVILIKAHLKKSFLEQNGQRKLKYLFVK